MQPLKSVVVEAGFLLCVGLFLGCLPSNLASAQTQPVTVSVADTDSGPELAPHFLGLSYETSMLAPAQGRYYFDPQDQVLVNIFRTLGIKSLRVGGNSVDNSRLRVPPEKDIDHLFQFARAAGVKVIYSVRLKDGNPLESARQAVYISAHYGDALDCFAIGNEPDLYQPKLTYPEYFALWKPHYDAILQAVPQAMFDGPSTDGNHAGTFMQQLAADLSPAGHLAMFSSHYYFLGPGRLVETNPPAARARFLSNRTHFRYGKVCAGLMTCAEAQKTPYRMDELNSCSSGGAKEASDTYAAALWALDCTHWWAAHHILGMNYHTGESVGRDGTIRAPSYASFVHETNETGFVMRPMAYALLAFTQGAHGRSLGVRIQSPSTFDFNAYAFRDLDGSLLVTLINKSYGDQARTASVALRLPSGLGLPEKLDLAQSAQDVAAKQGITLGDVAIEPQGIWRGEWTKIENGSGLIQVAPASAEIIRFRKISATSH